MCMLYQCLCSSALLPPALLISSSNNLLTFPECPEDSSAEVESEDDMAAPLTPAERPAPHRGNTMVHVCWHRNTSVSMMDYSIAVEVSAKTASFQLRRAPPLCRSSLFVYKCPLLLNSL